MSNMALKVQNTVERGTNVPGIQEAIRKLSDPSFYNKFNKDLTSANQGNHLGTHNQTRSTSHRAQNLIITTPRTSCIYFKPNILKILVLLNKLIKVELPP